MLKHIVMWKLKEFAEDKGKIENAKEIKSKLENLKGKINEIQVIEVGININDSVQSYDVVLYSEFKDEDALERYQKHPEHVKVGEFIGKVREDRVVADYMV
ncbi:stress responsive A/B barrel domain protein [Clostridium homopropionicum DSM 5847]|uniref:Stress responsive A/B barrel domain protein n=1 Tax=Clostridium homopropionicum DSM 5847 TaxID=1121318 RepID=A0A0L6Z8X4_9CLOT|nr:Dabb family protein [Clostridium homopropionicum]KOA19419.1 stress responsive A/B barrel domain protein [Clostridium homopropionicum DSM 5847]SFG69198.1 Stress responsive A/B Barrel Domain [Clostridium homopropionicum]